MPTDIDKSLTGRLKRLFNTNIVVRKIATNGQKGLKVIDSDHLQSLGNRNNSRYIDRYSRLHTSRSATNIGSFSSQFNYYSSKVELYTDYECLSGDTVIVTPNGNYTILQLVEKYPNKADKFPVYSYCLETNSVVEGIGFNARKTKKSGTYKIKFFSFSNNEELKATENHLFLMYDNTWKAAKDLQPYDRIKTVTNTTKVIENIEFDTTEIDVYDLSVEKYHNFATEFCFVHNCMDQDSIISAALDIYQEETILRDDFGDVLRITSDDENIKNILTNLFYDILNIDFNLGPWVRNLCKYGDFYLHSEIQEGIGIVNVTPLSAYEMSREEGFNPNNLQEVRFRSLTSQQTVYENYEITHFRMLSDSNFLPYGRSMLEGARKVWKSLTLMEDAMLIHRIMRAPEKRVYKIDVGNIPPTEVDAYMEKIINKMKKVPYVNQTTGEYNLKFNMQNMLEDYFLPVRGGQSGTEIDTLPGMEFTGIEDIEYLRTRMMASLKIPSPFLGYGENLGGKASLAAMDVRFARTIEKIQRIVVSELTKLAVVHLYAQGYTDANLVNFELSMTSPSVIYEEEKLSLYASKVALAGDMMEKKLASRSWIYKNIFNFAENDIEELEAELLQDQKTAYRYTKIEEDGEDPNNPVKPKKLEANDKEDDGEQVGHKEKSPSTADADQQKPETQTEENVDMSAKGRGMPKGGWPDSGRPKEPTKYNTHKHPRGYDPLGSNAWERARKEKGYNESILKKYGLEKVLLDKKKLIKEITDDNTI